MRLETTVYKRESIKGRMNTKFLLIVFLAPRSQQLEYKNFLFTQKFRPKEEYISIQIQKLKVLRSVDNFNKKNTCRIHSKENLVMNIWIISVGNITKHLMTLPAGNSELKLIVYCR